MIDPEELEQKKIALRTALEQSINSRISVDQAYLQMLEIWAQRSCATRTKTAAFLIKNNRMISDGYNGLASGMDNMEAEYVDPLTGNTVTSDYMIHAEANCFDKLSRTLEGGGGAEGATLYTLYSPCVPCSLRTINNKVKRVVFAEKYRIQDGVEEMRRQGIIVDHVPLEKKK